MTLQEHYNEALEIAVGRINATKARYALRNERDSICEDFVDDVRDIFWEYGSDNDLGEDWYLEIADDEDTSYKVAEMAIEKERGRELGHAIRSLYWFNKNASEELFKNVFGEVGAHLWSKYVDHDKDLIAILPDFDGDNMVKLALYCADVL